MSAECHAFAFKGDCAALRSALSSLPAGSVHALSDRKSTMLYTACRFGHVDTALMLIDEFGADVNSANASEDRSTPVHGACYGGHVKLVAELIARGANATAKNGYGETPTDNARQPAQGVTSPVADMCAGVLDGSVKFPTTAPKSAAPTASAAAPVSTASAVPSEITHSAPPKVSEVEKAPAKIPAEYPAAKSPPKPPAAAPSNVAGLPATLLAPGAPAAPAAAPSAISPEAAAAEAAKAKLAALTVAELRKVAAAIGVAGIGAKAAIAARIVEAKGAHVDPRALLAAEAPALKVSKPEAPAAVAAEAAPAVTAATAAPVAAAEPVLSAGNGPCDEPWVSRLKTATFTKAEVEKDTEEFWALEERVNACNQGHNDDYVTLRLKKKKKPLTFIVKRAWKVSNPTLESGFKEKMAELVLLDKSHGRVRCAFHGTKEQHIDSILKTSLLRFGHPLNPCKTQADDGYFGSNKSGVYVSRYFDYTLKYSNELAPLDEGQCAKVIMFKCVPGKSHRIEKLTNDTMGMAPTPGAHSHSSPSYLEWYLFDERQLCPEYVVELQAKVDTRTAADDE